MKLTEYYDIIGEEWPANVCHTVCIDIIMTLEPTPRSTGKHIPCLLISDVPWTYNIRWSLSNMSSDLYKYEAISKFIVNVYSMRGERSHNPSGYSAYYYSNHNVLLNAVYLIIHWHTGILLGAHTNSNTGDTCDTISQIVVLKCILYT